MKKHAAPIVAALLVLLPVLYVGSYLALVTPFHGPYFNDIPDPFDYRWGGEWAARIFWPIEQIDRKVRSRVWEPGSIIRKGAALP